MGIVACFASTDAKTIDMLRADPDQMEMFLFPDDDESEPPNYYDIDKAWHCIDFMLCHNLTKEQSALKLAIMGGEAVGEDVGYGPARILSPQQVLDIANALAKIDAATFKSRYDPPSMEDANIYLADMCVRDGDEALDYLLHYFLGLCEFYQNAAQRGDGVIAWLG